MTPDPRQLRWRKSSLSGPQAGNCVEVAVSDSGCTYVRDSKASEDVVLKFSGKAWIVFLDDLRTS